MPVSRKRGVSELDALIRDMAPVADPMDYVFATLDDGRENALLAQALMMFREDEATTLILPASAIAGDDELAGLPRYRRLTLTVHSSLDAVGLTSAVSRALTEAGIAANVVAAYYHDHVFVPAADASRALATLKRLSGHKPEM